MNKEFEDILRDQPIRPVPRAWREEILSQARHHTTRPADRSGPAATENLWPARWQEWVWPHPLAWAGLAAIWLVLACLNLFKAETGVEMARSAPASARDSMLILEEQQRRWNELLALLRSRPSQPGQPIKTLKLKPRSRLYEHDNLRIG